MVQNIRYETPEMKIMEWEQGDILTASQGGVLEDDKTWGEIS